MNIKENWAFFTSRVFNFWCCPSHWCVTVDWFWWALNWASVVSLLRTRRARLLNAEPNAYSNFLSGNEVLLFPKRRRINILLDIWLNIFNTCTMCCVMWFAQIPPQEHFPSQNTQKSPLGIWIFIEFDILDGRGTDKHISLTHSTECSS